MPSPHDGMIGWRNPGVLAAIGAGVLFGAGTSFDDRCGGGGAGALQLKADGWF